MKASKASGGRKQARTGRLLELRDEWVFRLLLRVLVLADKNGL